MVRCPEGNPLGGQAHHERNLPLAVRPEPVEGQNQRRPWRAAGFTLIELITIMIVIGILSIAALPRFFDRSVFDSRGFYDETQSLLRYAQKTAIAQRRTVCVALGAGGVALTIDSDGNGVCNGADAALALPNPPRGGAGLAASVAAFQFNSQGGTDQVANITVNVAGATGTITVDAVTGYVQG